MRTFRILLFVLLAATLFGQRPSAQGLTLSLFERYFETVRQQVGVPGVSVTVLQNGVVVWERGFGRQDVDAAVAASPSTPYPIDELSQSIGATLLLKKCVEESYLELTDPVTEWFPGFAEPSTVGQLLTHIAPTGQYRYDMTRFAALTPVVEACAESSYAPLLSNEIFGRFSMLDSVPGTALATPTAADREQFTPGQLNRYADVLRKVAVPYRVDSRGRATRSDPPIRPLTIGSGVVTTVRDLAIFDRALMDDTGLLLETSTRNLAFTPASFGSPTGLGWFVQSYKGESIVWQFGVTKDAYSSLILKIPNRGLTLIALANSDGLTAPIAFENPDVTASPFADLFLRTFLP